MTPPQALSPGTLLASRYIIETRLGAGGYGEVYAARDNQAGGMVAVKILHHEAAANDPRAVERMRQEAEFLRAIDHPHIVRVFDVGVAVPYGEYLVMERVEGMGLDALIADQAPLPDTQVLRIGAQLLSALDAAHHMGILHRDLKPENILISTDPEGQEHVKLVDFGIAKASTSLNAETDEGVTLVKTRVNSFVGTSRYAAPEMIVGDPLEPSADLFCVGLVLYEALTGQGLIKGTTRAELMHELVFPRPFDLSAVPEIWRPWLDKALEKSPSRRFQTTQEALDALASQVGDIAPLVPALTSGVPQDDADAPTRSMEAPAAALFREDALPRAGAASPGEPLAEPAPSLDPLEIAETSQWESLDIDYDVLRARRQQAALASGPLRPASSEPSPRAPGRRAKFGALAFIAVAILTFLCVLALFFVLSSGGPR
ncbi:serine/threonine-protein kinase [Lujinxingia litoralis]|nr:serine/threonine-protein kinase [Lujinxingia litoralis]